MSIDLSNYPAVHAPPGATRLIPSRFPPVSAFATVTNAADLEAVMFLEGWTNDRLVAPRLARLDPSEWIYGRPNASVVMAAFLHGSQGGLRFSDGNLGAWYASTDLMTAVLEVANGLRKEISLSAIAKKSETYRQYKANLTGNYIDIFERHPEYHDPSDATYPTSQVFGEAVRSLGPRSAIAGIRYQSVRHSGHENWVCFRPSQVRDVVQADHFDIEVPEHGSVVVRKRS